MAKIISYNVNGIRAALSKGLMPWLINSKADIICLQEIKASPEQLDTRIFEEAGFRHYWHPAQKKGYSGVAILSKITPDHVEVGCGIPHFDFEGRILRADYGDVSVMSIYIPSGSSGELRQDFKMIWLDEFQQYIAELKKQRPNLILSGDFNICHKPIDIHNPISNAHSSGFLPEERAWIDSFMKTGFIDSFREFNQAPHNYTWWSYRSNAREKNLGWRIDYHLVSESLKERLKYAEIFPKAMQSDHCPLSVDIELG